MSTYEMIEKSIAAKKNRDLLTTAFIEATKSKMDVFMMNDRISEEQYNKLNNMMG